MPFKPFSHPADASAYWAKVAKIPVSALSTSPVTFHKIQNKGLDRAKAFGCGLSMVKRI
ncbi:MAG: hypothetical protein KGZ69_09935 [Methylomonas sp.]|nr:hypothetical protein [Methylomonas sp.]